MTSRSQKWFQDAIAAGVDGITAYYGTEVIDSWEEYWKPAISDENLRLMREFALKSPRAALHRWSILGGPRPWVPNDDVQALLAVDPKWSLLDDVENQRNK
jgi:hypothetical protein